MGDPSQILAAYTTPLQAPVEEVRYFMPTQRIDLMKVKGGWLDPVAERGNPPRVFPMVENAFLDNNSWFYIPVNSYDSTGQFESKFGFCYYDGKSNLAYVVSAARNVYLPFPNLTATNEGYQGFYVLNGHPNRYVWGFAYLYQ